MARSRLALSGMFLSSSLMILASGAHAFGGWPAMLGPLKASTVDPLVIRALGLGWIWGSVSMLCLGVIALANVRGVRQGVRQSRLSCYGVSFAFLAFGIGATIYALPSLHFVGFVVLGAMLAVSVALYPDAPAA